MESLDEHDLTYHMVIELLAYVSTCLIATASTFYSHVKQPSICIPGKMVSKMTQAQYSNLEG